MDKAAVKTYAVWARTELVERVTLKAQAFGVCDSNCDDENAQIVNGVVLAPFELAQRRSLIAKVRKDGFERTMEEVAYAWFNRFAAIRFMEVNRYLPSKTRFFTDDSGAFRPQILKDAAQLQEDDLEGLDPAKVYEFKQEGDEALFKYLLALQCNALGKILPQMFPPIPENDYATLLLPDKLLGAESVLGRLISDIPEDDWKDQVQIVGWLYQYYNTVPKAEVFANLKKNVKIEFEKIPAATQLFTPDWIVRYMVENSLGRLWIEGRGKPENADWKYYLDEAKQEPEVEAKLAEIRKKRANISPEEIKCLDPCMGSGHILVYMFDVLIQIYESCGYSAQEAAPLILKNNLFGLDIDKRAAQLAYFAVMMKARQYDKRIFSRGIQPNVFAVVDSNELDAGLFDYFVADEPILKREWNKLVSKMVDARGFGSLIDTSDVDFQPINARLEALKEGSRDVYAYRIERTFVPFVQTAEMLATKFDVVCTNPPYMGGANMNAELADYVKENYPDGKMDLFSCFMERCFEVVKPNGFASLITMESWMFLSRFEKFRKKILSCRSIINMLHMPYLGKGGTSLGINFGTDAVIMNNTKIENYNATYQCITYNETNEEGIPFEFPTVNKRWNITKQESFSKIPGSPVAYWASDICIQLFNNPKLKDFYTIRTGLQTGNNDKFLRYWFEVYCIDIDLNATLDSDFEKKWYPHTKGGSFRKWYGNYEYVVFWQYNGKSIKNEKGASVKGTQYYFSEGITWSHTTSISFSGRLLPEHFIINVESPSIFECAERNYVMGMLNSTVASLLFDVMNSTFHYLAGNVSTIPIKILDNKKVIVSSLVEENIALSKADWDSFETSWDFRRHPLINGEKTLSKAFERWADECKERFETLKRNEEELNRIFIEIYGLGAELSPEVADKDVTVRLADRTRDVKSFISYAVGVLFGRYSLDVEGLAFAGGDWDAAKSEKFRSVPEELQKLIPDLDNIIPICDDDYFPDDITRLFVEFVKWVYGAETLKENLQFIADSLGKKGAPQEAIRSYFQTEFYKDHCQTYQKLPIYWLFDSGKKNGFKALVYLHRYQPDVLARIRTDYVLEQQSRYIAAIEDIKKRLDGATPSERVKLGKELKKFVEQEEEIRGYEEKIHHLADQMIKLDLDDGVKRNYELFKEVLAPIK